MRATEKYRISILEKRIIENRLIDSSNIEVEDIKEVLIINNELSNGEQFALLIDTGEYTSSSIEAREFGATKEYAENIIAQAIFIHSIPQRIVGNFYIKVNKPFVETKLFTDRDKAIEWLKDKTERLIKKRTHLS